MSLWWSIFLAACTPASRPAPASIWTVTQLRALDPSDTHLPALDLTALYTRHTTHDLEIRLDLLDFQNDGQGDLALALDWLPGGDEISALEGSTRAWDVLITIPTEGMTTVQELNSRLGAGQFPTPRLVRDPQLDTIILQINVQRLPAFNGVFHAVAYSSLAGTQTIIDVIGPVSSETQATGRAPLMLAFWNTMPAHTPAQALRRWDGAHTGPLGQRHGLRYLLNAAERSRIPIFLLDTKTPLSLAALDALGVMSKIKFLQVQGLLSLPETLPESYFGNLPDWAMEYAIQHNREIAANFGLSGSQLQFASYLPENSSARLILMLQPDADTLQTSITRYGDHRVLPIPVTSDAPQQIDANGLNLTMRRMLLAAALAPDTLHPITMLGGDLPHSNWGDARVAGETMQYLAAHPWMQPMRDADILSQPSLNGALSDTIQNSLPLQTLLLEQWRNAPESISKSLAWDELLALLAPADPQHPDLAALRAIYLGDFGNLLAAAAWKRQALPIRSEIEITDCQQDTDFDGHAECLLFSKDYFAIIDPQGARLSLLMARRADGTVSQLVAPSSQFAVGLSDPSGWNLAEGVQADPGVIAGAFAGPWEEYILEIFPKGIRLSAASLSKTFRLTENGLRVEYGSDSPVELRIPLGVAPESRFTPGWAAHYASEDHPLGWAWGVTGGAWGLIQTSGRLTHATFGDDLPALSQPENPNYDYPPGHYFPFPLSVVTVNAQGNFWVQIGVLH